jgi:IS605 OrfB family transposase
VANRRHDFTHRLSSQIAKTHGAICIEDLAVKNLVKNHHLARSINDAAWGELGSQLRYKAEWYGAILVVAPRFFASTKTCSSCGWVWQEMTLADRVFVCQRCDLVADRDINAAANLAAWGEAEQCSATWAPDPEAREEVGPHEEVDRVEQVADAGGGGEQGDDRHHHAADLAHLRRRSRWPPVEVPRQQGTRRPGPPPGGESGAGTGTRSRGDGPGSGLAAGELTPERPSGNRTTLSKKAHGPRSANGTTTGPGDDQHAQEHGEGTPLPPAIARREEGQRGQRPRRELHGGHDPQHHAGGERLSALGQHHGQQQEGHHRHVVASRWPTGGRPWEDGDDLEGAHLAATVGRAEPERRAGHQQRGQAEEDPGVGQDDVVLLLARVCRTPS